jgi:hypothetical protein
MTWRAALLEAFRSLLQETDALASENVRQHILEASS